MNDLAQSVLRLSFPVKPAGDSGGAGKAQEAGMRLLCERAEDALEGHASLLETSERLRRSASNIDPRA